MDYVRYIDKTKDYYLSQGYDKPYQWAHYEEVPFAALAKPLAEARVGLLSTAELAIRYDPDEEEDPIREQGFRSIYPLPAATPTEKFYSRGASYDHYATHMDDPNSFFPVDRLREAAAAGRIGALPERFYGAYNNYSQRKVIEQEAPKVGELCRQDGIDACVLVPV